MSADLESDILQWIAEEARPGSSENRSRPTPIQLLILRLAIRAGEESGDGLTKSVELSLTTFDRANLYRLLRAHERKGNVLFVRADGSSLNEEETKEFHAHLEQDKALGFVILTHRGKEEVSRVHVVGKQ